MHVTQIRPGLVSVTLQPCRQRETRHVSFADELQDAQRLVEQDAQQLIEQFEPIVQRVCGVTHADGGFSGDARLGQSRVAVTDLAGEPLESEPDALFYDVSSMFEIDSDLRSAVYDMFAFELSIAEIERLCSMETQQWETD